MASASVVKLEKVILDLQECVADLKSEFQESKIPIDDDCTTLHRFCAKLEYILQNGLKSKTNILGSKKDYWDYFRRALASETGGRGLHDGVKFVKCMPDLKTSLGKGRGFVRFCLMHRCLADTLQRCLINDKITCQWYESNSIMRQSEQWSELVTCLYELSEVQFDLSPRGQDLDVAWPTFARKLFGSQYSWQPPSRSISISSISSIVSQVDSSSTPEIDNLDCLRLQEEITELEASREELLHDLEELKSGEENSHKIAENAIAELEQVKVQSESKCKVLLDENLKLKEEIKMSLEKLRDIEQKNASQIAEAEKHAQEQQALIEELQSENSRFQARKQDETTMCQKMDALEIEKSQLECYIAELRAELSALRSSEANYKTKVEYYQQELSDLQTKNGELKSVMQRLHTIKEEKAAENIMICQRLGELSTQFTASQASLQELHKEKCFLQRKLETVESENTAAACTITSMSKELKELKKQVDALENENRHSQWQALEMEKDKINLQKEMTDLKSRLQKSIVSLAVNDESLEQVKKSLAELKDGFQGIASDRTEYHMDLVDKLCDLESYVFRLGDDVKLLSTSVLQEVSSSATRLSSLPEISPGHSGSPEISKNSGNETSSLKNSIVVVESLFQKQEAVIDNLLEKIEGFLKGSYHFNAHMNVLQKLLNVKFSSETSTCAVTLQSQIADLENALTFKVDSRYHGNTFGIVNTMSRIFSKLCELLKKNVRLQLELDFSHRMSSQLVDYIQENRKQISEATIDVAATENIVALLHKEHSKLKTAEEILKYELQQKRKLLTSLREQLFSSRKQWSRAQKMNSNALSEWKDLRTEFSQRDKQASEESGFVDDQSKNTDSDIPEEEIASSPEASSSSLVNLPSSDSKTKTDSLVEDDDSESVSEPEGATAPEPARSRLDILEEQCRLLYVSLLRSSERSAYLEQRLQALFSSDEEPASDLEMPSTSAEASEQENNDPTSEFSHASDDPISIDVSEPSSPESNTHLWDSNALLSGQHSSNTSNGTVVLQDIENMNRSSETPSEDSCTQSMQDDADEDKELSCLSDSNDEENRVGALRKQALDKIVMKLKDERIIHDGEVAKLKEELDQLQSANAHLEERLLAAEGEKERIAVRESEFRKRVDFIFKKERGCFDAQITELIDSKSALESKVSHLQNELDSRDQLVASLEASMQKLTDELSETKSDMTKEILAVKLQHNAETLKYEQSLKHYIEQEEEIALLKEQIHDQSNMIVSLENNLVELKESYAEEKEKHWQQLEEIKMTLSVRDEECSILNEELKKALKELDEEKKKHEILDEDYQKKLVQLKEYIAMLESKLTQVQADNVELKKQYVKLIK